MNLRVIQSDKKIVSEEPFFGDDFFGTVLALNISKSREQTFYNRPGFTAGQFRKVVNSFTEFIGADTRRKES